MEKTFTKYPRGGTNITSKQNTSDESNNKILRFPAFAFSAQDTHFITFLSQCLFGIHMVTYKHDFVTVDFVIYPT